MALQRKISRRLVAVLRGFGVVHDILSHDLKRMRLVMYLIALLFYRDGDGVSFSFCF
jgi:hypothetical protein